MLALAVAAWLAGPALSAQGAPTAARPTPAAAVAAPGAAEGPVAAAGDPEPPEDPVGSPSRYTVAQADDLLVSRLDPSVAGEQQVSSKWVTPTTAVDGVASSGDYRQGEGPLPLVNRQFRQATGRFVDPEQQVVLSLRMIGTTKMLLAPVSQQADATAAPLPTWTGTLPRPAADSPFALAAGDLDRAVGSDHAYHDEAVMVGVDNNRRLTVQVADYTLRPGQVTVTSPAAPLPQVGNGSVPGALGVEVGDFDGDGDDEIAVLSQYPAGWVVTFLDYSTAGGTAVVKPVTTVGLPGTAPAGLTSQFVAGYADTAVGDFDGTGREGLALAFMMDQGGAKIPYVGVFGFASNHAVRASAVTFASDSVGNPAIAGAPTNGTWTQRGPLIEPGLFRYDGKDFSISRRQLALAYPGFATIVGGSVVAQVFDVALPAAGAYTITAQTNSFNAVGPGNVQLPFSMTTGGFAGIAYDDLPVWGIAIGASSARQSAVTVLQVPSSGNLAVGFTTGAVGAGTQYVVSGYDRTGRSLQLGAPVRFTVDALKSTTLIAEEPPKQADWLDGEFLNATRKPEYAITLGSGTKSTFSASTKTESDQELGFSNETDVSGTVKAGLFGLPGLGLKVGVKNKFSESFDEKSEQTNSASTTVKVGVESTSSDDDIVGAYYQTVYVFRYPILGLHASDATGGAIPGCAAPCNGFWEIQVPGKTTTVSGNSTEPGVPGRSLYWYQPEHQNGNALSYPTLDGNKVQIPDLGSYSYTDSTGATVTKTQALFNSPTTLGGVENDFSLDVEKDAGAGFVRSSERKLKENLEVSAGVTAHWVLPPVAKGEAEASTTFGFDDNQSWSTVTTGETETTTDSSFKLHVPQFTDTYSYKIGTAYYTATDGTQRVRQGVDLTSSASGSTWWKQTYGQQVDPAFNLPYGTVMTKNILGVLDEPKWNSVADRQRIRGFYALQAPEAGQPADSGAPYTANPRDGQKVTFAVEVHNFSLKDMTSPVQVQFYSVPVDANQITVTGPPTPLGRAQVVQPIKAQDHTTVTQPWTAVRPDGVVGNQSYRIFAVIDPSNEVPEIHELHDDEPACPVSDTLDGKPLTDPMTGKPETLACGTNNQGYGQVTVAPDNLGGPQVPPNPHLHSRSLQLQAPDGSFQDGIGQPAKATADQQVTGTVHLASDANSTQLRDVAVFDGPPQQGHLIATERIDGLAAGAGTSTSFTWTPRSGGRHVLYAVLLGVQSASTVSLDTLPVDVTPATPTPISVQQLPDLIRSIDMPTPLRQRMLQNAEAAARLDQQDQPLRAVQYLYPLRWTVQKWSGKAYSQATGDALFTIVQQLCRDLRQEGKP